MQSFFRLLGLLLCITLGGELSGFAQEKHAIFSADRDGDGIPDTGGQDKCPTTLSKIEGLRATTIDEISGKEITVQLPETLKDFVFQDKAPLEAQRKKLLNTQGGIKREKRRVEEKYGKYKDMKGKDRKLKLVELDSVILDYQSQIQELSDQIKAVDPASYIEFVGNLLDQDGNVLQETVKVKIRLRVDAFGCLKDDDRDGSPNMVDLCPDETGPVESSGCPDRDRDRIPDKEDDCPDTFGVKEANGCPDRDKDGVADSKDDCPDTPGLKELAGCPDRDKDGVADPKDDCPDTPGSKELAGCPDRDKDGIKDSEDACPDEAGPKETKGCPDRDKDGVLDKEDDCPDVPGPADNKGCPKILEKASRVLFETGKAVIKPVSYAILDELVSLLKEYPDSYIRLAGHTDSEGGESDNLQLSKDRAQSVKEYLVSKGIEESKISATGFGETRPIASNETPQGRSKNRRVEMKLSNQESEE